MPTRHASCGRLARLSVSARIFQWRRADARLWSDGRLWSATRRQGSWRSERLL